VGDFGDKFRKARESKELSLDDVSNVTKISRRMLQAIEEEQFDKLPGGVFNRGFIRAYAKHLGLNSEDAVNDYLACLRQAQVDSHHVWEAPARRDPHEPLPVQPAAPRTFKPVAQPQPPVEVPELPDLQLPRIEDVRAPKKGYLNRASSGIPWLRVGIGVFVLIAALFLWTRHSRDIKAARPTAIPTSAAASELQPSSTPATTTPAQTTQSMTPAPPPVSVVRATPATVTPPTNESAPTTTKTDAPNRAPAPAPATTPDNDPNSVKIEKKGDVTIRSFGATPATVSEESTKKLTLVVRASENSWISVTSDGQPLTQETLIAPAATSFHATRELIVRVGNAAGVSFLWNGEELPPQGAEAEAKTFIFDAQGMHAVTPPQN
jgi:cytoskeleton protein RodZ